MEQSNNKQVVFFGNGSASGEITPEELCVNTDAKMIIFSPSLRLRYILDANGNVWFPATETAKLMKYTNPGKAVRDHIEEPHPEYIKAFAEIIQEYAQNGMEMPKCHGLNETFTPCQSKYVRPSRRTQQGTFNQNDLKTKYINEAGFYALTMNSKMPAAICFQKWVCEKVLPQIRSTGNFSLHPHPPSPTIDEEIKNLQTRIDGIHITKTKCNVIKDTIPDALRSDFATIHDITNRIGLNTDMSTAEIKRINGIAKGLSIPDVMNDAAQERRIVADFTMSLGLGRNKLELASLPPIGRNAEYHRMGQEVRNWVNTMPFSSDEPIGIYSNEVAKQRKKEQQKKRKNGEITASPQALTLTSKMQPNRIESSASPCQRLLQYV